MNPKGEKSSMSDAEFFDRAALAALQGMIASGRWPAGRGAVNDAFDTAAHMVAERKNWTLPASPQK